MKVALICLCLTAAPGLAMADHPVAEDVVITLSGGGARFDVTVRHPDTGWEHYADGWEVLASDGSALGLRVLSHPHVNEMPFTRSLSIAAIPAEAWPIQIRLRCNIHGWSEVGPPIALPDS